VYFFYGHHHAGVPVVVEVADRFRLSSRLPHIPGGPPLFRQGRRGSTGYIAPIAGRHYIQPFGVWPERGGPVLPVICEVVSVFQQYACCESLIHIQNTRCFEMLPTASGK